MRTKRSAWALGLAAVVGLGALASAQVWAQQQMRRLPARPAAAAPAAPATAPTRAPDAMVARGMGEAASPEQQVMAALQQIHLTQCAAKVQQATSFIFEGQDANFIIQPLGPDSDRWPTVMTIESRDPATGHSRFSTLMISPNCAGMYEQMIYWPQSCAVVKETVFAKFTGEHPILREVRVSDAGPALQLYLTTAGAGCVSVKKELFR